MKRIASLALATLAAASAAHAQTPAHDPANLLGERPAAQTGLELPADQGASGLAFKLRQLRTRASLLMIVAHPDDEDGGMLTLEARGHGVRAATLTLTRGEGGQNLMTGDFNDALGLIRTQELLAADRYFGTTQYFGTEVDFGFSKTREEALAQWTHDRVLYDAVRAVRLFRPLVITSVFTGNPTDGHGHHQVSGQIAQEVFLAAGDPTVFPDQIAAGLAPWQPLKMYARVPFAQVTRDPATGRDVIYDYAIQKNVPLHLFNYITRQWTDTVPRADVVIHEGEPSPALGMSYVQFARQGLALQKSQIGAGMRVPPSGAVDVGYTRYGSHIPGLPGTGPQTGEEQSFFDGIDTSLLSLASPGTPAPVASALRDFAAKIDEASTSFDPAHPELTGARLASALHTLDALLTLSEESNFASPAAKSNLLHELRLKHAELEDALRLAFGITFTAETRQADVIAGTQVAVQARLSTTSAQTFTVERVWLVNSAGADSPRSETPPPDTRRAARDLPELTQAHSVGQLLTARPILTGNITRPFFSRDSVEQPFYNVHSPDLRNAPGTPPALVATALVNFRGTTFTVSSVVRSGTQPLAFIPPVSLTLPAHAHVLPAGTATLPLSVNVLAETANPTPGTLHLALPEGWTSTPVRAPLAAAASTFTLQPTSAARSRTALVTAEATIGQHTFTEGFRPVGYPGLTLTNLFTPAHTRIVPVNVQIRRSLRVAYLPGTGDEVPISLENIGIHPVTLSVRDLTGTNLSVFDTLVIGVRAYTAHPDLAAANPSILEFARQGGTVVVQYQAGAYDRGFAPFDFHLGGNGQTVTEELAPVTLSPAPSGVLTTPNLITAKDFEGWVEERGHGFPASFGPGVEAPTEVHDQGQDPQRGGLLVARVGKGYYVYCAFALYRQLPEAVPGAYRLFANLLSLGHTPVN